MLKLVAQRRDGTHVGEALGEDSSLATRSSERSKAAIYGDDRGLGERQGNLSAATAQATLLLVASTAQRLHNNHSFKIVRAKPLCR